MTTQKPFSIKERTAIKGLLGLVECMSQRLLSWHELLSHALETDNRNFLEPGITKVRCKIQKDLFELRYREQLYFRLGGDGAMLGEESTSDDSE